MAKKEGKLQIKVVLPGTADWERAVQLVGDQFRRSFDAKVEPHPDCFVTSMTPDDNGIDVPWACAGVTYSERRTLPSERYLDEPAEIVIGRAEGLAVPRTMLIEVGSLAAGQVHSGTELVRAMPLLCWCMGKRYVLCTATRQLRRIFKKVDINFTLLKQPDGSELEEAERLRWGSYYEQGPQTGYIDLAKTASRFDRFTGQYRFDNLVVNLAENDEKEDAREMA
jgi:hypothetical protein